MSPKSSQFDAVPHQMRKAKRWLLHRDKRPFYIDGSPRRGRLDSFDDISRLATFEAALERLQLGKFGGLGFALGPDETGNHWQGIDLDKVDSHPAVLELAHRLPGYVERSPSGLGLHAIGYGWREAEIAFNGAYRGRRALDASHDAMLCAKYSIECEAAARKLSRRVGLDSRCDEKLEQAAQRLWLEFRNLYTEVQDWRACWLLIALAVVDNSLSIILSEPRHLMHRSKLERIPSYDAAGASEWMVVEQRRRNLLADRETIFEKLEIVPAEAVLSCSGEDTAEIMHYALEVSKVLHDLGSP